VSVQTPELGQNLEHQLLRLDIHPPAEPFRLALTVDQGAYDAGETAEVAADTTHLLRHVADEHQGLSIPAGRRMDHVGKPRRRQCGVGAGAGLRQGRRVLQTEEDALRDHLILLVETGKDRGATLTCGDAAHGAHQGRPATASRGIQQTLEILPPVRVLAALDHLADKVRVDKPDLLMAFGELAHIRSSSNGDPMKFFHERLRLKTTEPIQVIDITGQVSDVSAATGLQNGLVTLISPHTTAYVNLNEREEMLQSDMVAFLQRLVPRDGGYRHNLNPVDDRENAHAHLMGLFMNASETIPISDGRLLLGGWQSIFFIELDGPREERQVILHFVGER